MSGNEIYVEKFRFDSNKSQTAHPTPKLARSDNYKML